MIKFTARILIVLVMMMSMNTVMAAQEKLEGRVYAASVRTLMPLGSGDAVISLNAQGIVAMSGDTPLLFGMNCIGMGLQDSNDKITNNVYCTFKRNDADTFDIKGTVIDGKGDLNVIGGSGRYAGATGKGNFKRLADDEEGMGLIEFNIRTR